MLFRSHNFWIYQLKDMAFSIFCYFLKILKSRTDDVVMTSSRGSGMLRTNSSRTIEIGRGNFAYELEGEERSQGGGGIDQMVTGGLPATMAAAERRPPARRRECRGEGGKGGCPGGRRPHHEHEEVDGAAWGGRGRPESVPAGGGRG